jgi:glycosyltransferase involved in cell wall biosynthesis
MVPRLYGVGGMVSFQRKMAAALEQRGIQTVFDLSDLPYEAVLVIGGTRQLFGLWQARQRGIPVIQRLDGMNWLHRLRRTGARHYLRAEYGNLLLKLIRNQLASALVYQSQFSKDWWQRVHGAAPAPDCVVYNGVDLQVFHPQGNHSRPDGRWRVLLVEGSLMGGYEAGLETAFALMDGLARKIGPAEQLELMVVGRVDEAVKARCRAHAPAPVLWAGKVPGERIPEIDRSAHLLFSSDINAACPNSVIEALACGLPVIAYDTGALPELVTGDAGRLAHYGGDPWRLDPPDIPALVEAASQVLASQPLFRSAARQRAEAAFDLQQMAQGYLEALNLAAG